MADDVTMRYRLIGEDVSASKALDGLADNVDEVGKRFDNLKATAAVGAAAAGAAAGAVLAKGFADNMEFGAANSKLTAQLDLSAADSAKAGEVAGKVYSANWGGSLEEVNGAIKAVSDNLGGIGKQGAADLQATTTAALALSQVFGVDVAESTAAAGSLIKNGLAKNSQEAFDIITAGFQNGADKAGDFTDTLTEYSPHFAKLGISGAQAMGILSAGLQAGARDTDFIADSFAEFSKRSIDGSKLTAEGFRLAGLDANAMATEIAKGGPAAEAATSATLDGLLSIKDPIVQNTAGVALFGTQWEDTVRQILPALAGMGSGMTDVTGATDRMAAAVGDNAQAKIDGAKRSMETWTASLVSSQGPLGAVATGVVAFGGTIISAAGSVGMLVAGIGRENIVMAAKTTITAASTAAQWLWNAALSANPIGIVIVAIAALVAGLIYFFTQTETGRRIWTAAMAAMSSAFNSFLATSRSVLSWIGSAWSSMVSTFQSAPGRVAGAFSSMFNGLRDGFRSAINFIVGGWNRLRFGIPGFSFAGISIPGINIGVPHLARGGVVTKPTLAMVGEGGQAEAVVPLDRANEMGFGGGGGNQIHFHFPNAVIGSADHIVRAVNEAFRQTSGAGFGLQ